MRHAIVITLCVVGLVFVIAWAWLLSEPKVHEHTRYITVEKTIPGPERTIPGPETTVFKKRPGATTWIIVCGENTQRVVGSEAKPITECNLPDTSGGG